MKKLKHPIDSNIVVRYLGLHYFIHIFRTFNLTDATESFSRPRFDLFKPLKIVTGNKQNNSLLINLLYTFQNQIIIAAIVTIIGASFNLLVPELIRSFVEFMNLKDVSKKQLKSANIFLYKFVIIQTFRLFFAQHSKRLFHELAIQVQSTLARKLVSKSLKLAKQCRDKIPQSEIISLQNVDLKLIFTLFKNMYLIFQAPFTIIVAIIMLFTQSKSYGFIAVYWFVIAFLIQRELDGKMTHCNKKKLDLIEKRSRINYELLQKMKEAKIIGYQNLIIQKNNDLFIQQNHDHQLYYRYSTLYDITLLMLPILVVVTISLYDINQQTPITVQQVYSLIALLGTCYMPMKSTRTISISMHDGLRSINKLCDYFGLDQEIELRLIQDGIGVGEVFIKNGTKAAYSKINSVFQIQVRFHIQIRKGDRFNVISRKSHGSTSFLQMIIGNFIKLEGSVLINGKIAYKPEKVFFVKESIHENIKFYNKSVDSDSIHNICKALGIDQKFRFSNGIYESIDDMNKFTDSTLQKIAIARVLVSNADILILDSPFQKIDYQTAMIVQQLLRQKQNEGKTIIIAIKSLQYIQPHDKIVILNEGKTQQYGTFEELTQNKKSFLGKFFKSKEDQCAFEEVKSHKIMSKIKRKFTNLINDRKSLNSIMNTNSQKSQNSIGRDFMQGTLSLATKLKKQAQKQQNFSRYIKKLFTSVHWSQSVYIRTYWLRQQQQSQVRNCYTFSSTQQSGTYRNSKWTTATRIIVNYQSSNLSTIIYLQGQVSSYIAIIVGNRLYQEALNELTRKRITWFANQYTVKIADRFNHDYQEIFIAVHGLLGIYKNVIIFIATIQFINTNRSNILLIMIFLITIYFFIFKVIRNVEKKVIKNYYDYKYNYVKVLEESIRGAQIFRTFNVNDQIMKRTEQKYRHLASYKLSESYTTYAISILTDLISILLLGCAIFYGLQMKTQHKQSRHIALIATSITLLMNLSQVLKTIIKESLNFGTFFSINIMPFLQILDFDTQYKKQKIKSNDDQIHYSNKSIDWFDVRFENIILRQPSLTFKQQKRLPLNLKIKQGERVLIYETDDQSKNILLYSLTRNLPMLTQVLFFTDQNQRLMIGQQNIRQISPTKFKTTFGVIQEKNFYFSGTLKENIINSQKKIIEQQVLQYIKMLGLDLDLMQFNITGIQTKLKFESDQSNPQISKKLALLRILIYKPKIIIIKDTTSFIESISMIQMIDCVYTFKPTIIKIDDSIESSFDVERVIYMENLQLKEEGPKKMLIQDSKSQIGNRLKDINIQGYLYTQRTSLDYRKKKTHFIEHLLNPLNP